VTPDIEGTVPIRSSIGVFVAAMRERVATGLLTSPRARYVVSGADATGIEVRAVDWRTAIDIGLNQIELSQGEPGSIHYRVRYWRWASYVIGLSGAIGFVGVALMLGFDVRDYIERHQASRIPGLSTQQNLLMLWVMIAFWGFVWPWVLIAAHKVPLRRLITSIITDVDARGLVTPSS
jgi:hypothetical protein